MISTESFAPLFFVEGPMFCTSGIPENNDTEQVDAFSRMPDTTA